MRVATKLNIETLCLTAACILVLRGLAAWNWWSPPQPAIVDSVALVVDTNSHPREVTKNNDTILVLRTPKSNSSAFQPSVDIHSSQRLFQDLPSANKRTFYAHSNKICHGMIRALRSLGWTRVNERKDAQLIWTYVRMKQWYPKLKSWQRYNHIPRTYVWNHKNKFAQGFRTYQQRTGFDAYFLPETYNLNKKAQVAEFKKRLLEEGGLDQPWVLKEPNVNQGLGVTMLAPNSKELKASYKMGKKGDYIIQNYICNEMTWDGRKFDTRMYWFVASLDPLIVFYMDGYARIGNSKYKENDFKRTRDHLTTHTFLGEEGKGSFDEFADRLVQHYTSHSALLRDERGIHDPVQHVKSQFKEAIARTVDAFKNKTFQTGHPLSAEDAFELYGADFVVDNDLDVWLIEPQDDTGMDEDHYFRLEMHHNIYHGMITILEEIWDKQARGGLSSILPIHNTGLWEVVYADGWMYEYKDYRRSKGMKKKCG